VLTSHRFTIPRWVVVAAAAGLVLPAVAGASLVEEPGSPFAVGSQPFWATAADFDGDGRSDLAVANDTPGWPSGTVSILLRQAGGGFSQEAGSPITVGGRPDSIVAGDFHGDERRDLATPSFALSTVTVLLRKQDNSGFVEEAGSPIGVGSNPTQLAPADYDGDGQLDMAAANHGSDDVTVLLRKADNSGFAAEAGTPPAVGDAPVGIQRADFDADGRADLAVIAENGDNVTTRQRKCGRRC
jgi:hypothetical protein